MDLDGKKQFEALDWLTQTIEPFEWEGTAVLAAYPDEVDLPFELVVKTWVGAYGDIMNVLQTLAPSYNIDMNLFRNNITSIVDCFDIKATDNVILDLEENTMTGTVTLVKTKKEFTDKEILSLMVNKMRNNILIPDGSSLERLNEIVDLLDLDNKIKRSISVKNKVIAIKNHITVKIEEGGWKIKDVKLAESIATNITAYVKTGDANELDRFIRFKMMTHSGLPIYKVEVK